MVLVSGPFTITTLNLNPEDSRSGTSDSEERSKVNLRSSPPPPHEDFPVGKKGSVGARSTEDRGRPLGPDPGPRKYPVSSRENRSDLDVLQKRVWVTLRIRIGYTGFPFHPEEVQSSGRRRTRRTGRNPIDRHSRGTPESPGVRPHINTKVSLKSSGLPKV